MIRTRERFACLTLLVSFLLCIGTAIGTPLGVRYFLRNARVDQKVTLEQQRGTPRMQRGGQGEIIALVGVAVGVTRGTVVTTGATDQGALTLYDPGDEPIVLSQVQIYADSAVTLLRARSPRFNASPLTHEVALSVTEGRVRISVAPAGGRPTIVELQTPHLTASLNEGSYEVRVHSNFSELAVRDGDAQVTALNEETVDLGPSQRTIAQSESTTLRVLSAERNLLTNGQFQPPISDSWEVYQRDIQQEPAGTVEATTLEGRSVARLHRSGFGHVEIGIRQSIEYDVRDFASLVFHLNVQIRSQSLTGCGSLGSECPIMVRIDYKDTSGTDRVWYHGFYSAEATPSNLTPEWDEQIPAGTWFAFDSGNLIELFQEPPALIKTVTLYASGHSFDAFITDVELLAQE